MGTLGKTRSGRVATESKTSTADRLKRVETSSASLTPLLKAFSQGEDRGAEGEGGVAGYGMRKKISRGVKKKSDVQRKKKRRGEVEERTKNRNRVREGKPLSHVTLNDHT